MNRTWTFVISKSLTEQQLQELLGAGNSFVKGWTAHDAQLSASFEVFRNRIIIVKVNEDVHAASGCSIDKLTRFIKEIEQRFEIQLMNRLLVAFEDKNGILNVSSASEIRTRLENGEVSTETLVYNTSVADEQQLQNWLQPLKNTWLNKYLVNN